MKKIFRVIKKMLLIDNKGSATVEAALALPIFLFGILGMYSIGQCKLAEVSVYEASIETAEYLAEYAYFDEPNQLLAGYKFGGYLDDKKLVEKYVQGGVSGINFIGSIFDGEYVRLKVNFNVGINLPFISKLSSKKSFVIKQKYYRGNKIKETGYETEEDNAYVFVTDNRDVYHEKRSCTHLTLSVSESSRTIAMKCGYTPCERCRGILGDRVYVTDSGMRFHSSQFCSGLKRRIYRVKRKDVSGLRGCSRCSVE